MEIEDEEKKKNEERNNYENDIGFDIEEKERLDSDNSFSFLSNSTSFRNYSCLRFFFLLIFNLHVVLYQVDEAPPHFLRLPHSIASCMLPFLLLMITST